MKEQKQSLGFISFLPGIAWFLFVLILICLPGEDVPDQPGWLNIPQFDKVVHAGLFGGLVFWFCFPFKKWLPDLQKKHRFIKITLSVIIWGITTEFIQKFFIPGRQFDLTDWAADSAGAVIAFFICKRFFF